MFIDNSSFEFEVILKSFETGTPVEDIAERVKKVLDYVKNSYEEETCEETTKLRAVIQLTNTTFGVTHCKVIWESNDEYLLQEIKDIWNKVGEVLPYSFLQNFNDRYVFGSTDNKAILLGTEDKSVSLTDITQEIVNINNFIKKQSNSENPINYTAAYTKIEFDEIVIGDKSDKKLNVVNIATQFEVQLDLVEVQKNINRAFR